MAFLTLAEARAASRGYSALPDESVLRKQANQPDSTVFDVFLSHAFLDAGVIVGVKALLEQSGFKVYVDWIDDGSMDRRAVTPETARILRSRMQHSKSLIFATSEASKSSKWMPWELGYFDGHKPGRVAILPLVQTRGSTFDGQEYLGLYPNIEDVPFRESGRKLGIYSAGRASAMTLSQFVSRRHTR